MGLVAGTITVTPSTGAVAYSDTTCIAKTVFITMLAKQASAIQEANKKLPSGVDKIRVPAINDPKSATILQGIADYAEGLGAILFAVLNNQAEIKIRTSDVGLQREIRDTGATVDTQGPASDRVLGVGCIL